MRSIRYLFVMLIATACLGSAGSILRVVSAQTPAPRQLHIIAFGAHPDDAELKFAGTAALFAAQGHKVKLVAMTNGDVGHFAQASDRSRSGARRRSPPVTRSWASRPTSSTFTTAS